MSSTQDATQSTVARVKFEDANHQLGHEMPQPSGSDFVICHEVEDGEAVIFFEAQGLGYRKKRGSFDATRTSLSFGTSGETLKD